MTIAELLRAAAAHVEGCAPKGETWDHDTHPDRAEVWAEMGEGRDRELIASFPKDPWTIDNAGWVADMGPQLRQPLIDLFEGAARDAEEVGADWQVVALARAVLGETGEQR